MYIACFFRTTSVMELLFNMLTLITYQHLQFFWINYFFKKKDESDPLTHDLIGFMKTLLWYLLYCWFVIQHCSIENRIDHVPPSLTTTLLYLHPYQILRETGICYIKNINLHISILMAECVHVWGDFPI